MALVLVSLSSKFSTDVLVKTSVLTTLAPMGHGLSPKPGVARSNRAGRANKINELDLFVIDSEPHARAGGAQVVHSRSNSRHMKGAHHPYRRTRPYRREDPASAISEWTLSNSRRHLRLRRTETWAYEATQQGYAIADGFPEGKVEAISLQRGIHLASV